MKHLRTALGALLSLSALAGIAALLYMIVGEWYARRQLSPGMRTPEAIQTYYDGAVCLDCQLGGIIILMMSFLAGVVISILWGMVEVLHIMSERSSTGRRHG